MNYLICVNCKNLSLTSAVKASFDLKKIKIKPFFIFVITDFKLEQNLHFVDPSRHYVEFKSPVTK